MASPTGQVISRAGGLCPKLRAWGSLEETAGGFKESSLSEGQPFLLDNHSGTSEKGHLEGGQVDPLL